MEETKGKKKGGRPTKKAEAKRTHGLKIWTTEQDYHRLKELAEHRKQSVSTMARDAVNNMQLIVLTREQEVLLSQLASMANNLNQLTYLAHRSGMPSLSIRIDNLLSQMDSILDKWLEK